MRLFGYDRYINFHTYSGRHTSSAGLLVSDELTVEGGWFGHGDRCNYVRQLAIRDNGVYKLSNGVLRASNVVSTSLSGFFEHTRVEALRRKAQIITNLEPLCSGGNAICLPG
jgi:hypothetical protein